MSMANRKIKNIDDSELYVRKIISEEIDKEGNKKIQTEWVKATKPINLGSVNNPNKNIKEFKFVVPEEEPKEDFFGDIFKNFKK